MTNTEDTSAELLIKQLENIPLTGCRFVSLSSYENAHGEVADHLVNVGVSYENAKKADIKTLEDLHIDDEDITKFQKLHDKTHDSLSHEEYLDLLLSAQGALLESLEKPASNRVDPYEHVIDGGGLKKHTEKNDLYVWGFKESKKVITEASSSKKPKKSRALTIAKDYIKDNYLKTSKYAQYKLNRFQKVKINGEQIIFE